MMTRTTRFPLLFTLLCTAALLVAPAVAQPGGGPHGPHGFHGGPGQGGPGHHGPGPFFGADADQDGAVSQAELDAVLASIDADEDGILSHEELQAHHQALREADAEDGATGPRGPRQRMMRHMLRFLDADGDGQIQTSEVQAHFDELDADGDGVVTEDERPCPRCGKGPRGAGLFGAVALKAADADQNGEVTLGEWKAFLATVDATFERFDENGDGVVSENELPRHRRGPRR